MGQAVEKWKNLSQLKEIPFSGAVDCAVGVKSQNPRKAGTSSVSTESTCLILLPYLK